ncbi:hypothetical protein KR067_010374 [Drosophila pandora]|nr:hypothetical protein KR067_010374 [Drosophila pandora]
MYDGTKYFARSLDSYHPSQSEVSVETDPNNPIKYGMVKYPTCDEELLNTGATSLLGESEDIGSPQTSKENIEVEKLTRKVPYEPQIMIIYEAGDIHSALHFLIDSAQNPFDRNAIAMVFIEKKIIEEVVQQILSKLKPLSDFATQHNNFWDSVEYIKTEELKSVTVNDDEKTFPVFVYDITHDKLGNEQTGVITLHSFTKNEEIIEKYEKETLSFKSVCSWNETLDGVYEIVAAFKCPYFYINCCNVNLGPIQNSLNAGKNDVVFENGFHYETITIYTLFKLIVFPIGDAIVAKPSASAKEVEPISFLEP